MAYDWEGEAERHGDDDKDPRNLPQFQGLLFPKLNGRFILHDIPLQGACVIKCDIRQGDVPLTSWLCIKGYQHLRRNLGHRYFEMMARFLSIKLDQHLDGWPWISSWKTWVI
jgi:hypothetical protein